MKLNPLLFILSCVFVFVSCVQTGDVQTANQNKETVSNTCDISLVDENLKDPQSIEELTNLINALPKPLTGDCLMKSLKRPLYVNATASTLSAQPANSWSSPRIFIFKGNLIISLVATGVGAKLLEFSELINTQRSVKGELVLPIENDISYSDPFSRINYSSRTSCSGCHGSELFEKSVEGVTVYSSLAFRPPVSDDVSLDYLREVHYLCQAQIDNSQNCAFMKSLFSYGTVVPKAFPTTMSLPQNTFGL